MVFYGNVRRKWTKTPQSLCHSFHWTFFHRLPLKCQGHTLTWTEFPLSDNWWNWQTVLIFRRQLSHRCRCDMAGDCWVGNVKNNWSFHIYFRDHSESIITRGGGHSDQSIEIQCLFYGDDIAFIVQSEKGNKITFFKEMYQRWCPFQVVRSVSEMRSHFGC